MNVYDLTMTEEGVREWVATIIDTHERTLAETGSYDLAMQMTQDVTIASLEDKAEDFMFEAIELTPSTTKH